MPPSPQPLHAPLLMHACAPAGLAAPDTRQRRRPPAHALPPWHLAPQVYLASQCTGGPLHPELYRSGSVALKMGVGQGGGR
jgi:hypothetical protein